ncbi:MAG: zinc-binding dehydrogenase [Bacteroidales bacterium]|jgi:NADPH2:quinone reductase
MKAIFLVKNGESREAFEMREAEVPVPGKGEVVIKVAVSGLNYADVMARRGLYKEAPPIPCVLGYDVAGTIHAIGPQTPGFKIGQHVAAMTRFGGYAEYVKTQSAAVIALKNELDFGLATSLATQASTAVYCAGFAIRLYNGERVLVHAAAGGVGTLLVQLAKEKGCIVYGSASSKKHGYLKDLGVDFPIDSHTGNPIAEIAKVLGQQKLDVIFDNIGGLSFKKGKELLGPGGRMVCYGAAAQNAGNKSKLQSLRVGLGFGIYSPVGLIVQSQTIAGVNMLRLADHKPEVLREVMTEVSRLAEAGIIRPVLGKTYRYDEIAQAHDFLESRQSVGKVALLW